MKTLNLDTLKVVQGSARKYGNQFYKYAHIETENNEIYNISDPFPGAVFPRYEAITSYLFNFKEPVQIKEKQFRQLFKGVKKGAEKYAQFAENLENNTLINFI
jgi:hypothetical protein